jgi:hypothetical protein
MQKLLEITNCQKPGHFNKFKKPAWAKVFESLKMTYGEKRMYGSPNMPLPPVFDR